MSPISTEDLCRYHFRYGPNKAYTKDVYANDEEYFADVAKAYQTELKILYDAGLRNGQVDDPNLACMLISELMPTRTNRPPQTSVPTPCSTAGRMTQRTSKPPPSNSTHT